VPSRPRWFALADARMRDRLALSPRLITWVARVEDLTRALAEHCTCAEEAVRVSRGALSWLIGVPADGSMPFDGAFPALIEWPSGPHPASAMADLGCRLEGLRIGHPDAAQIARRLAAKLDDRITFHEAGEVSLEASIITPRGVCKLT